MKLPSKPLSEMPLNEQFEEVAWRRRQPMRESREIVLPREWPTREQWAERRRTLYVDEFEDIRDPFICTPIEVETISGNLKAEWSRLRGDLRIARLKYPQQKRKPGERSNDYTSRYYALSEAEKAPWNAIEWIITQRKMLQETIQCLRGGGWPRHTYELIDQAIAGPLKRADQLREAAGRDAETRDFG